MQTAIIDLPSDALTRDSNNVTGFDRMLWIVTTGEEVVRLTRIVEDSESEMIGKPPGPHSEG